MRFLLSRFALACAVPLLFTCLWNAVAMGSGRPDLRVAFQAVVLFFLGGVACVTDLRSRKIPNWITYSACLSAVGSGGIVSCTQAFQQGASETIAGLLRLTGILFEDGQYVCAQVMGQSGLVAVLLGAAACFTPMYLLYRTTGRGAGDVKLATAIGSLLGPINGINVLIVTYLVAGACAFAWAVWKYGVLMTIFQFTTGLHQSAEAQEAGSAGVMLASQPHPFQKTIPLAPFFVIGTMLTLAGLVPR